MLDPVAISQCYTLTEIETQITELKAVYDQAIKNRLYQLDDMHSRQRVEQHDIDKIAAELTAWLRAKAILTGASQTQLLTIVFTGNNS